MTIVYESLRLLLAFGVDNDEVRGIAFQACTDVGWRLALGGDDVLDVIQTPEVTKAAVLHVLDPDEDWNPFFTELMQGVPVAHAVLCTPARLAEAGAELRKKFVWINAGTEPTAIVHDLRRWLLSLEAGAADPARGIIEALHREVQLGVVENEALKALIADLTATLAGVTGELTESQQEIRTLEALHRQLEKQNDAFLLELSKGRVQPETASAGAKALKFGVGLLVTLALNMSGQYVATKAALTEDQSAQLMETSTRIVQQCDQVIYIAGD